MFNELHIVSGAITGFVVGLTGVGGGALMTPILLLFFGVAPTTAIATDLWFAAITKVVGARVHWSAGYVDWGVATRLWLGSLPVAIIVALTIGFGNRGASVEWLVTIVGAMVLVAGFGLLVSSPALTLARRLRISRPRLFKRLQPVLTVVAGAFLGLCVALTSVGAGALGSVLLVMLYPLRMTPHRLVATDLVHAIPLAIVAGFGYLVAGAVDWGLLAGLLIGSIPAVIAGSRLAGRISATSVRRALAIVLIAVGIKVLL